MKILFVSMPSVHVIRWIENLKDTNHELYWFDILDRGKLETLDAVQQFTGWKKRKIPYIKGEYFLSKKLPRLYNRIILFCETTANEAFENIILEIQPDVIHSFEMQSCSYSIFKAMKKNPELKWIYSCWGNDLFYFKNIINHNSKIKKILHRVNYLHTDCQRDYNIARELGFGGKFLGVIPGGTGYKLQELEKYKLPVSQRKIILVKGYEHIFGRGLNVIKALEELNKVVSNYEVIVFGAHQSIVDYIASKQLKFKVYDRHALNHDELMKLMGEALIYTGNSISDGMANTLLEAIVMGSYPIQSNPGGVTQEIISPFLNGAIISNPNDIDEIKEIIKETILNADFQRAYDMNQQISYKRLDYDLNKQKVIKIYNSIFLCG
jgi:hypothetical protein